jgi:flagellin
MAASRNIAASTNSLSSSLARLSSGSKIVSPEDDVAGLAQSIRFDEQINRNHAVQSNLNNAISFSQTQDCFLVKAQSALDRMSELSVMAQDVTKPNTDRSNYSVEFVQLQNYLEKIDDEEFNGVDLWGDYHPQADRYNPIVTEVTIDSDGNKVKLSAVNYSEYAGDGNSPWRTFVGIGQAFQAYDSQETFTDSVTGEPVAAAMGILNTTSAASALSNIQTSIQNLANLRASVGSNIQRLKLSADQVGILNENLMAANSRIMDLDVADESTEYARYNILVQGGTAMLYQANLLHSVALQLIV